MERGITTLAHQSRPSTLFSFSSSHGGRNRHNAGVGGANSEDAISPPTRIPARQEEELEGGYYDDDDDEDNDAWFEERHVDEDQDIIQEDRSMNRREEC